MDRLLKPGELEVLSKEPDATKIFDYWPTFSLRACLLCAEWKAVWAVVDIQI